jgi:hypothetical protein
MCNNNFAVIDFRGWNGVVGTPACRDGEFCLLTATFAEVERFLWD